jgi:hypothetical protein
MMITREQVDFQDQRNIIVTMLTSTQFLSPLHVEREKIEKHERRNRVGTSYGIISK